MGVLGEVDRAITEIKDQPMKQIFWQEVFRKYPPAFIGDCERSVEGTRAMVTAWLAANMLNAEPEPQAKAIVDKLMDYNGTTEHGQHFLTAKCKEIGLNITDLEADQDLQDAVLSLHHAFVASFSRLASIKIIENNLGITWNVNA